MSIYILNYHYYFYYIITNSFYIPFKLKWQYSVHEFVNLTSKSTHCTFICICSLSAWSVPTEVQKEDKFLNLTYPYKYPCITCTFYYRLKNPIFLEKSNDFCRSMSKSKGVTTEMTHLRFPNLTVCNQNNTL